MIMLVLMVMTGVAIGTYLIVTGIHNTVSRVGKRRATAMLIPSTKIGPRVEWLDLGPAIHHTFNKIVASEAKPWESRRISERLAITQPPDQLGGGIDLAEVIGVKEDDEGRLNVDRLWKL